MLNLALVLVLSADPAADCAWKEPKSPPALEVDGTDVKFKISSDPNWFRCAKKAGGKLNLTFSIGEGGNLLPKEPKPLTSYSEVESAGDLCATPGQKQVQASLKGTGPMERLDWSSAVVEVFCARCQWAGDDNMLVLHTRSLTPPGTWTLEATFDPTWYACAKKGGALELRLFTADSSAEVKKLTAPTHVVKGLDGPKVKKTFALTDPCKGKPKYVGYELGGTGEFQVLPAKGRAVQEAQCP
jgi:hypothetical protein